MWIHNRVGLLLLALTVAIAGASVETWRPEGCDAGVASMDASPWFMDGYSEPWSTDALQGLLLDLESDNRFNDGVQLVQRQANLKIHWHAKINKTKGILMEQKMIKTADKAGGTTGHSSFTFFLYSLIAMLMAVGVVAWFASPTLHSDSVTTPIFRDYRAKFIVAWALVIGADWVVGGYVFAIYASFGYGPHDIHMIFAMAFLASMICGPFVGIFADRVGRKRAALLCCVVRIAACLTKHCSTYWVIMVGRAMDGISCSLLYTVFEAWMVSESTEHYQFSTSHLNYMFGLMYFVSYLVAIGMGIAAEVVVRVSPPMKNIAGSNVLWYGGNICPYDLACVLLVAAIFAISLTWNENYGNSSLDKEEHHAAAIALTSSWRITLLGVVVACFEGCMFVFVISWTPALDPTYWHIHPAAAHISDIPLGIIFSAFMSACMLGSSLFGLLVGKLQAATLLTCVLALTCLCFACISALCMQTTYVPIVYFLCLLFEFCVGMYFPCMGTVKSKVVPEEGRTATYNCYRVPVNLIVIFMVTSPMQLSAVFAVCACVCAVGTLSIAALSFTPQPQSTNALVSTCASEGDSDSNGSTTASTG